MAAESVLVRLSPAPGRGENLQRKIQLYFQSAKQSGGGECQVLPGPEAGTYWVHFQQERDKKRVESRRDHVLQIGDKQLEIIIQAGEGELSKSRYAEQASPSHDVPSSSSPAQQEQPAAKGSEDKAKEVLTKKIFLTVSATLNTSMFTVQQREKITTVCPNLKREGNLDIDGFEKLTGDFADIEEAYSYFKGILADNDPNYDFSHSESKKGLEEANGPNTEETDDLVVVSSLYEYFSHACKEKIKQLWERFGVYIRSKDLGNGNTSVCLLSDGSPASIEEAQDFFIRAYHESVKDLKQEIIPITNSGMLNDIIMNLNTKFSNLLVREEENQLLLRGPPTLISAAKRFLSERGENGQAEKNMKISSELYEYRNGIEVDASVFKLLETILSKEMEDIQEKFDTVIEKEGSSYGQKTLIVFRPRIKTCCDMSSHAAESFINAFQNACAMLREKPIILKLSEKQKERLSMLLNGKQLEGLHVKLKKQEDKLILTGLPNHLCAAEKHIMEFLDIEDSTQTQNRTSLSSDLRRQERKAEKKYNDRQKNHLSSEGQSQANTDEEGKDKCPICMERIKNKEKMKKCNHEFCKACITQALAYRPNCPICKTIHGPMEGNQPEGTMSVSTLSSSLPGYPNCGTILITYVMKGGIQTSKHPNPGRHFVGTTRMAYLPDNEEGQEILHLLRRAFDQKLIFTVGRSCTTGRENVITWNDIHHKTSMTTITFTSLDSWNKDELSLQLPPQAIHSSLWLP
ncbi:E3 ubiquitin-protein ligase DTX3L isoform X2 [Heliangelus exortis]|uniref:E3 ubiquitin-protein ligase DTX3L isoform X2 n=1 Tax=Heliangelus exortis TaxID=472823 RepID=UPI003A8DDE4C